DVAGYSRLISLDEVGTVRTLTAYRNEMSTLVAQHRGRVVDNPEDNALLEFPSATDAVEAAIEIQEAITERNTNVPVDRRMEFRIGVHLGEVMVEDDRIYGEGVNVAARLEVMAPVGGICVSKTVRDQVISKIDATFTDLGEQELKNIPEPIRAYRLDFDGHAPETGRPDTQAAEARRAAWIAVLPFENMSGDPNEDYFADGITEEVITGLAAFRSLRVIARTSSFLYKNSAESLPQIAKTLGVRFVLEGSVRKAGDHVRVTAQLIEAPEAHHIWADRYDVELVDIFDAQDRITQGIVTAIDPASSKSHLNSTQHG
ncbi:MAG: adenylate/guanylate cyclase domain-containing protein, partial [Actinomycetota bacterium]|nr:adenylate/guanylate cyclase domain-containing protein [Actinomycetota bacterium]